MKVYVGQTRSRELTRRLSDLGFGEVVQRGELPPRRLPFFHDNGAFRDYTAREQMNLGRWIRDLRWMAYRKVIPDFVVIPDLVAGGAASLSLSIDLLDWVPAELAVRYLVVQDGMSEADVALVMPRFHGVFVGGETEWKEQTAPAWVAFAHARGLPCHVGRVGTARKVRWAREIGADSVDSSLPLRSEENLDRFIRAVEET